jgi:hypothetical protein
MPLFVFQYAAGFMGLTPSFESQLSCLALVWSTVWEFSVSDIFQLACANSLDCATHIFRSF